MPGALMRRAYRPAIAVELIAVPLKLDISISVPLRVSYLKI